MNAQVKESHPTRSTTTPEYFFHFKMPASQERPRRTISHVTAFVRQAKDGKLYVSFAECDSRDTFTRSRGRSVARRKWFANQHREITGHDYDSVKAATERYLFDEKPFTPDWE